MAAANESNIASHFVKPSQGFIAASGTMICDVLIGFRCVVVQFVDHSSSRYSFIVFHP